jgi:hypothetical protein
MFICERCGYSTKIKCNLTTHLKRKIQCDPIRSNACIKDLLKAINDVKKNKTKPIDILTTDENVDDFEYLGKHICDLCNKVFTSRQGKYQHKKYCKGTDKLFAQEKVQTAPEENFDKLHERMDHIMSELYQLKNQGTHHTTNNINITNINITQQTNVFILNSYKEMASCIKDETMTKLLSKTYFQHLFDSLKEIVRLVYYNDKHPENHALYIPNVRNRYAKVWNGENWMFQNRDEVLTFVRNKTVEMMNDFFHGNENCFSMMQKQHLRKWHDRYYDDSDKLFDKKTKTAVEETILSYQSIVKKTIDKYNLL